MRIQQNVLHEVNSSVPGLLGGGVKSLGISHYYSLLTHHQRVRLVAVSSLALCDLSIHSCSSWSFLLLQETLPEGRLFLQGFILSSPGFPGHLEKFKCSILSKVVFRFFVFLTFVLSISMCACVCVCECRPEEGIRSPWSRNHRQL